MEKLFAKFDLNWHAVWRKAVIGSALTAAMGGLYTLNKRLDDAVDDEYPKPSTNASEEEPAS